MDQLIKDNWYYQGRWVQPVFPSGFWLRWSKSDVVKELTDARFDTLLLLDGHTWIKKRDWSSFKSLATELSRGTAFNQWGKRLDSVGEKHVKQYLALSKTPSAGFDFERLLKRSIDIHGLWHFTLTLGEALEEQIIGQRDISAESLLQKVESIKPSTWLEQQNQELVDLAKFFAANSVALKSLKDNEQVKRHVKNYEWLNTHNWVVRAYTLEEVASDLKRLISRRSLEKKVRNNANGKIGSDIRLLAKLTYWRTHCAEVVSKVSFQLRDCLHEYANSRSLEYEDFTYLTYDEARLCQKTSFEVPKDLSHRKKAFGVYLDAQNKDVILLGKELKSGLEAMMVEEDSENSEVKGFSVVKKSGKLKGRARIVIASNRVKHFKEGDILIAPETTPDYIFLMKKAGAIVTDGGGITSHAAIVARELNTFCIVGTKHATKIFKDGDMVEVDANKGIVRKVNLR